MAPASDELDQYRQVWESDQAWNLRKSMLSRHWGTMEKNRLLCLSQILSNVHELGTTYDMVVMEEVKTLANGLLDFPDDSERPEAVGSSTPTASVEIPEKLRRTSSTDDVSQAAESQKRAAEDLFCRLRAHLTVDGQDATTDPLRRLNVAINSLKGTWVADINDNECTVIVENVVLVTTLHWGDILQAKMDACHAACEVIKRKSHKVLPIGRTLRPDVLYELHSAAESTDADHHGPSKWRLEGLKRRMALLNDIFQKSSSANWKHRPQAALRDACAQVGMPLTVDKQRLVGWTESHVVKVGNVVLYDMETRAAVQQQQQNQSQSGQLTPEDLMCTRAIENLSKLGSTCELREVENFIVRISAVVDK